MKSDSEKRVLVLRNCPPGMVSRNDFKWPESGPVEAPDWDEEPECGNGLHGWLWGEGEGDLGYGYEPKVRWLVVSVAADDIVDLGGKVKFARGEVVFCGDVAGATEFIRENGAAGRAVIGSTATAGDRGTANGWGQRHRDGWVQRHRDGWVQRHRDGWGQRHRDGWVQRHRDCWGQRHRDGWVQRHRDGWVQRHRDCWAQRHRDGW